MEVSLIRLQIPIMNLCFESLKQGFNCLKRKTSPWGLRIVHFNSIQFKGYNTASHQLSLQWNHHWSFSHFLLDCFGHHKGPAQDGVGIQPSVQVVTHTRRRFILLISRDSSKAWKQYNLKAILSSSSKVAATRHSIVHFVYHHTYDLHGFTTKSALL